MAETHALSLTSVFAFVAVEALVFGTLGLDAISIAGVEPHVH